MNAPFRRLFFALWPDAVLARALAQQAVELQLGDRRIPADRIHATVVFLGDCDHARQGAAEAAAERVRGAPFELLVDHLDGFARAGVCYAGVSAVPEAAREFKAALDGELQTAGFELEQRPWIPHLTLARRCRCRRRPLPEKLPWAVAEFALVASKTEPEGAVYQVLRRWNL